MQRRKFLNLSILTSLIGFVGNKLSAKTPSTNYSFEKESPKKLPISVCTWNFEKANQKAGVFLDKNYKALDAAIEGVAVEEANENNTTVGIGAAPDRDGNVTLDACVMNDKGDCGSVMAVQNIMHVAALAREIMYATPHVILAGKGAEDFALQKGFSKTQLLTPEAKKKWEEWKKKAEYAPKINIENHDTIGMLCLDNNQNLSGACTTSGLAYKMKGRVGDSPIIGSGLFVDNDIAAAVATGMGEEVIKTVGSFLIVELIKQGRTPQEACEEAIDRIIKKQNGKPQFQVGFLALDKNGNVGAYSIHSGFSFMKYQDRINKNYHSKFRYDN